MDPKASAQLDPKLQEAYNKIMGVNLNTPANPPDTSPTPSSPIDPTASNPTQQQPIAPTMDPAVLPSPTPITPIAPASTPLNPIPTPIMPQQSPQDTLIPNLPTSSPTQEINTPANTNMVTVENTASLKSQAFVAKGGSKISPVILIVGGLVFLILYTIIWIKVFNIPVPYINQ